MNVAEATRRRRRILQAGFYFKGTIHTEEFYSETCLKLNKRVQ